MNKIPMQQYTRMSSIPSIFSTSDPESDDSVSVGHFVALIMDSSRFFDIPKISSRQIS